MASALADRGALKPHLTPDAAAGIFWLLNDPSVTTGPSPSKQPPDRSGNWLAGTLISLLIPASYQPETARRDP